jgi:hypothetical protein
MEYEDPFAPGSVFRTTILPAIGWEIPPAGNAQTYDGEDKYHISYERALQQLREEERPLMKFTSNLITDARGSMGGITADRGKSGMYFKGRGKAADRRTETQLEVRKNYGLLEHVWQMLSNEQRSHWQEYFKSLKPNCKKLGIRGGFALAEPRELWKSVNMALLSNGYPLVTIPPIEMFFEALPNIDCEILPLETRVYVPGGQAWQSVPSTLNISNSRPVSMGRSYPWAGMKKAGTVVTNTAAPYPEFVTIDQNDYPNNATGQKVWVSTYVIKPDGSRSHRWSGGPYIVMIG